MNQQAYTGAAVALHPIADPHMSDLACAQAEGRETTQ